MIGRCKGCKKIKKLTKKGLVVGHCSNCVSLASYHRRKKGFVRKFCKRCKRVKILSKTGLSIGHCKSCISLFSHQRKKKKEEGEAYCQECGKKMKKWNIVRTLIMGELKICNECIKKI